MTQKNMKAQKDTLYMIPLGGCGVFGANMTLYGYNDEWIMVDCGMGFADDTMPGVDILLPDPTFAAELEEKLLGIIITHGHEDHIGGIPHLWPRLKAPVYATDFAAGLIKRKTDEQGWHDRMKLHALSRGADISVGPFSIKYIPVAHSIPEAHALAISIEGIGTWLHTGDWKLDNDPVVGELTDETALRQLGEKGVIAMVGDSTNAMVPGHSGSEAVVRKNLIDLFGEFKTRIVVSCFSSNVARLQSVYEAAKANGRKVCLVGRSLWRMDDVARETGYLQDTDPFVEEEEALMLPRDKVVYIVTGSQGEPRAALSRIANDDHKNLKLAAGDVVLLSSRTIPGNEKSIDRMKNLLLLQGVDVITDRDAPIHVSGHPYRDELKAVYDWVKPASSIPVHGEQMQLEKHAQLAAECGIKDIIVPTNGKVIKMAPGKPEIVGEVPHGMLALEGNRLVAMDHEAIMARKRIMWHGSAVVTIVVDAGGNLVAEPKITALGLLDENCDKDEEYFKGAIEQVKMRLSNVPKEDRSDDTVLSETARIATRKYLQERFGRKPQTRVHLVRI